MGEAQPSPHANAQSIADPSARAAATARRGGLEALALLLAALLASLLIGALAGDSEPEFGELALGPETQALYAAVDGAPIHCQGVDEASRCIAGWRQRGAKPLVLWLGNSQLHAINQLRPGDQTASALVQAALRPHNADLLAFSQPNANLQEHYVLFRYLLERAVPRVLVLSVVFDDTRESGLRPLLAPALSDAAVVRALEAEPTGRNILERQRQLATGDLAALEDTLQQSSETALTAWLDAHFPLWASRPRARGNLFSELYKLRNRLLGITAQTKRPVIPGRLALNLDAARALLRTARERNIDVLVYIVPLRDDIDTPYVPSQYAAFKESVAALARAEGAHFENLESLVPGELWGSKIRRGDAELDFMHFQGPGHALLADAVLEKILEIAGTPLQ